ncbi:signal peptidase II [Candidatus Nomurabacteria bacterium]|nr:signal peptidase II [Candidatus Nomurabacteria bacterium]
MKINKLKSVIVGVSTTGILIHHLITKFSIRLCTVNSGISLIGNTFGTVSYTIVLANVFAIVIVLLSFLYFHKSGFIIVFIGGLSNLVDRIFLGGVCDYLRIGALRYNINDVVIVIGIVFIIYEILRENTQNS